MLRKLYCATGKKLFMTSSGDHLLPQATKTLEAGWIKILENSFQGNPAIGWTG